MNIERVNKNSILFVREFKMIYKIVLFKNYSKVKFEIYNWLII